MVYKQSETGKFLRLKNFMELDMKDFIHKEFYNSKTNPFHLEPENNYKYKLTSLIVYSSSNPTRDGYLTYVKQKDGSWIKFSKYSTCFIKQSEVEEVRYPAVLIYRREFEMGNERSNIRSQLEIMSMARYKGEMKPIPDFWMQRAVYLHSPGNIFMAHYVCKHLKLKPHYKDVHIRKRRQFYLTDIEQQLLEDEDDLGSSDKSGEKDETQANSSTNDSKSQVTQSSNTSVSTQEIDEKRPPVKEEQQLVLPENNTYCEYQLETVSSFLPAPIADYIVERFCKDMDVETYRNIDFEEACQHCIETQKRMLKRRYFEKQLVKDCEARTSESFFVVASDWLMQWKLYLCYETEDDKFMKQYFFDSFDLPQKIDNSCLYDESGEELREDLKETTDYYWVNCYVFEILERLYGVDKIIGRAVSNLEAAEMEYSPEFLSKADLDQIEKLKAMEKEDYKVADDSIMNLQGSDMGDESDEAISSDQELGDADAKVTAFDANTPVRTKAVFKEDPDDQQDQGIQYEDDEENEEEQVAYDEGEEENEGEEEEVADEGPRGEGELGDVDEVKPDAEAVEQSAGKEKPQQPESKTPQEEPRGSKFELKSRKSKPTEEDKKVQENKPEQNSPKKEESPDVSKLPSDSKPAEDQKAENSPKDEGELQADAEGEEEGQIDYGDEDQE